MEGELDPGALETAVAEFSKQPHAGAVCGRGFLRDNHGKPIDRADIVTLLFTSSQPFLPAGIFRLQALRACGLHVDGWRTRASNSTCVFASPAISASTIYNAIVKDRRSTLTEALPENASQTVNERMNLLTRFLRRRLLGSRPALLLEAQANLLAAMACGSRRRGSHRANPALSRLQAVVAGFPALLHGDHRALKSLHRLFCTRSHNSVCCRAPSRES